MDKFLEALVSISFALFLIAGALMFASNAYIANYGKAHAPVEIQLKTPELSGESVGKFFDSQLKIANEQADQLMQRIDSTLEAKHQVSAPAILK